MDNIVEKLKKLNNKTQDQVTEVINNHAYESLLRDLKEDGIDRNDLSDEEFKQLLAEEINTTKSFAKGAASTGGLLLFLDMLG